MNIHTCACITLIATCCLQACTTSRLPFPARDMIAASEIPPANPALDQYIARVPGDIAQTATVARAMTHISLGRARDAAEQRLCDGNRLVPGEIASVTGPFPAANPDGAGTRPVWYYRISQQPGIRGCNNVEETRLFEVMRSELPAWISIERAESPYTSLGLLE